MPSAIEGLKPEPVWQFFAEISKIPRGSKNEAAITQYVLNSARKLKLDARADKLGNVVVRKSASPGRENVRSIALQGHLDMVCEKNRDKIHDFLKDPIELVRDGDLLRANGTTLGADNGIAVAASLAIMRDRSLEHGPLEFLFTVDEETGLTGANSLTPDFLESRTLLNLDSEEEGELYVGCSGGKDTIGTWEVRFEEAPARSKILQVKVSGLKGGHSGLDIDKGRGNAVKIMGRVLSALASAGARLVSVEGGNKHNAIPRECEAWLLVPQQQVETAGTIVGDLNRTIQAEFSVVDPGLRISVEPGPARAKRKVMRRTDQVKILRAISALPHGTVKMSAEIQGLVETSTNLAVIRTTRHSIRIATSQRSSVASEIAEISETVSSILVLAGASIEETDPYPGWKPQMDSPILALARSVYRSLYAKEPQVKAIHAGLECGIIGERIPGMDMVSFGPTLEGVHSPDEKIHIDTVERFWEFLLAILKAAR